MVRGESGSGRRARAELRRDTERFRQSSWRVGAGPDVELAASIAQRAGVLGLPTDPDLAADLGDTLTSADRVVDATELLRVAVDAFDVADLGARATRLRRSLLGAAEQSGGFALAIDVGEVLLRTRSVTGIERGNVHGLLAEAQRQVGDLESAGTHLEHRAGELAALQSTDEVIAAAAWTDALRGVLAHEAGDLESADAHLRARAAVAAADPRSLVMARAADVLIDRGELATATELIATANFPAPGHRRSVVGSAGLVWGRALRAGGRAEEALGVLEGAELDLTLAQRPPLIARVHRERAICFMSLGRLADATARLEQARAEFARLGCAGVVASIDAHLGRAVSPSGDRSTADRGR